MTDYYSKLPASIRMSKKKRFNYIMSKIEESKTPGTNNEGS